MPHPIIIPSDEAPLYATPTKAERRRNVEAARICATSASGYSAIGATSCCNCPASSAYTLAQFRQTRPPDRVSAHPDPEEPWAVSRTARPGTPRWQWNDSYSLNSSARRHRGRNHRVGRRGFQFATGHMEPRSRDCPRWVEASRKWPYPMAMRVWLWSRPTAPRQQAAGQQVRVPGPVAGNPHWWRRGESNPRPQALRFRLYVRSCLFVFSLRATRAAGKTLGQPRCLLTLHPVARCRAIL